MNRSILFFYSSNHRTVALETLILEIHRRGIPIELLTTCERGPLHDRLEAGGIPVHAHVLRRGGGSLLYYARQALHLAAFCRKRGFTVVFSNLQQANFIAVLAQSFMRTKVVAFRHHAHYEYRSPSGDELGLSPMEIRFDAVINRLARRIVVPSRVVLESMREHERVDLAKVTILPYVYDFAQYGTPDAGAVTELEEQFPAHLRLLMSARLVPLKRHDLVFPVIERMLGDGLDVTLLVLDDGPDRERLDRWIRDRGLQTRIVMLGFRQDFLEVMAASDLLVHPSVMEASCNVVKEMALLGRPSLVCHEVGDFDDYLSDGHDAFMVRRDADGQRIYDVLRRLYDQPQTLQAAGEEARRSVLARFSLESDAVTRYLELA